MLGFNHNPTQLAFLSGSFHNFLEYPIGNFLRGEQSKYRVSLLREAIERALKKQENGYSTTDAKQEFVRNINNEDRLILGHTLYLPHTRLTEGAQVGFIDYGLGTIKKEGDLWRDIATTTTFKKLSDIRAWVQTKGIYFCDVINDKDIANFETLGVIRVNSEMIAKKAGTNRWLSLDNNKELSGNITDVLYQLAIPYISASNGNPSPIYLGGSAHLALPHTVYVDSVAPSYTQKSPLFDTTAKRTLENNQLIELSLPNNACAYHANWDERKNFKCILNTPSPFLLSAISDDYGDSPYVTASLSKVISRIHSTKNNYETYTALLEWSEELSLTDNLKKHSPIESALRAMGYDSLTITPPTHENILDLIVTQSELMGDNSRLINTLCKGFLQPEHIKKTISNYIDLIVKSSQMVPQRCTSRIFFNKKKHPSKVRTIELPIHDFLGKRHSDSERCSLRL